MTLLEWCNQNTERGTQLLSEWVGIDADGYRVDINSVSRGSGKKVYWKCSKGHKWLSTINNRTASKSGCPECAKLEHSKIVSKSMVKRSTSLLEWCNQNKERGTQLLSEWTGITETGGKYDSPSEVTSQSNKQLLWRCKNEHEWFAKVQKRTLLSSNCPYCSNQKITSSQNDLYTWCINNNKRHLIDEWVGIDSENKVVDMHCVAKSSHKKVYWKHIVNGVEHKWLARISDRTTHNSRCPICHGKGTLNSGKNDLETWCHNNPDFGKTTMELWVGETESGEKIKLNEISHGSHTKVAWKCSCGNTWYETPLHLIYHKHSKCNDCRSTESNLKRMGTVRCNSTSLLDWCKQDKVYGDIILKEWTGKDEYGNNIDISQVTYGSTQRVKWEHTTKAGESHVWLATIHNRTRNNSMCPHCNNKGTSLPEQIIYRCFKQLFPNTISRGRFQGYEIDIVIPELKLAIEYGSTYYHTGREERDKEKVELCKRYNITLVNVIDDSNNELEHIESKNLVVGRLGNLEILKEKIQYLFKEYNLDFSKVNYDFAIVDSVNFMIN